MKTLISTCASCEHNLKNASELSSLKIKWLNSKEAAVHLRIPVKSLLNLVSSGEIPYYKYGRLNRYIKNELDTILLQNRRGKNGN